MPFIEDLLESLINGLALNMSLVGKGMRKGVNYELQVRKGKPLQSKDWQFIANAITDPTLPSTLQARKIAQNLKDKYLEYLETLLTPDYIKKYIKNNNLTWEVLDELSEYDPDDLSEKEIEELINKAVEELMINFSSTISNWDWQMFANGLVADD